MATPAGQRKILFAHWDGAGNLPPQQALARELLRRGHDVHVLTHDSVAERVKADGVIFHHLATAPQSSASRPVAPEEELGKIVDDVLFSRAFAEDFEAVFAAMRPDVLVIDTMLFAVLERCLTLPVPTLTTYHTLYTSAFFDPLVVPWLNRPGSPAPDTTVGDFFERFAATLVFSYPAFSPDETFPSRVVHFGPIREAVESPPWPRHYPDRALVMVSLSTSFQSQQATLQTLCDALAALPVEAIVTTGPSISPESLRAADNVELRAFVPHDRILTSADLVITHCGHGTVMAAAGAGVPMLCMPMGRDQPMVAGRVEALGLGRAIAPDAPPDEIGALVQTMLADPTQRAASRAFAAGVSRFGDLTRAAEIVEQAR